jgi:hypothetical protein
MQADITMTLIDASLGEMIVTVTGKGARMDVDDGTGVEAVLHIQTTRTPEGGGGTKNAVVAAVAVGTATARTKSAYHTIHYIRDATNAYFLRRKRDKSVERKARKAEKKRLRAEEEARQVAELSVYSATDNPFHDVNLGQQFHWHKKSEKERKSGMTIADSRARDITRRQEAQEELARLNKRRAEREEEMRLREEEDVRMHRLAETAATAEWTAKEGDWALEQERKRAAIRIKEKRAKAVDFLALNLRYANPIDEEEEEDADQAMDDAGLEIDLDEPYNIFDVRHASCLKFDLELDL